MYAILLFLVFQIPLGLDRGLLAPPENPLTDEKVALGRRLFFDKRLSADNSLACSDCHQPQRAFSDGRRVAVGVKKQLGDRNSPAIINRAYGRSFFWDGRISSLEEQVLQPIQNPKEMAAELADVVERLKNDATYRSLFHNVFSSPPEIRWLSHALASYVRTLLSGNSAYDRYEAGQKTALSSQQQEGLRLFRGKARCATCHSGSNFTDEEFHNTGVAWNGRTREEPPRDTGRGLATDRREDEGKFKTPTLRDIEVTGPYMHDGSFKSLAEVLNFYDGGGHPNAGLDPDIRPLHLTAAEKNALLTFLKSLTGSRSSK